MAGLHVRYQDTQTGCETHGWKVELRRVFLNESFCRLYDMICIMVIWEVLQ